MGNFQAVYYRDPAGAEPVRDFLDGVDDDTFAVLANQTDRLNLLNDAMVPIADIRIANDRFDDFRARMDAEQRKPPRPAGHDAP